VDFGLVSAVGASVDETRDDRAASSYGQHGATRGCPCGSPEKGNKDPWNVTNVLIYEQGGDPVPGQRANHLLPSRRAAEDDFGAESASQSGDQLIDAGIVESSRGGSQGDARNRQPGAEKLPGAAVACGEDGATSALESFKEILGALKHAEILEVLWPGVPQPGHLGKHEAEMACTSALDSIPLALVEIREGDLEMGANSLPTSGQQSNRGSTEGLTNRSGKGQRESASDAEKAPEAGVEDEASGAGRHGASVTE